MADGSEIAARTALRMLPNIAFGKLAQNEAANLLPLFRGALTRTLVLCQNAVRHPLASDIEDVKSELIGIIDVTKELGNQAAMFAAKSAASAIETRIGDSKNTAKSAGDAARYAANARRADEAAKISEQLCDYYLESAKADFDKQAKNNEAEYFSTPLFSQKSDQTENFWQSILSSNAGRSSSFLFWREWYQGFLDGKPMDWELQRRVALIDDAIWEAGPEAVADEIERIRAQYNVEIALKELASVQKAVQQARLGIGGNNPPEPIEDAPVIERHITMIWAGVNELTTEVEAETPDKGQVERALEMIRSGLVACLKWCAKKGDFAVDTLIKWGVPAAGGYLALNPDKVSALIKAVEAWLPFL